MILGTETPGPLRPTGVPLTCWVLYRMGPAAGVETKEGGTVAWGVEVGATKAGCIGACCVAGIPYRAGSATEIGGKKVGGEVRSSVDAGA